MQLQYQGHDKSAEKMVIRTEALVRRAPVSFLTAFELSLLGIIPAQDAFCEQLDTIFRPQNKISLFCTLEGSPMVWRTPDAAKQNALREKMLERMNKKPESCRKVAKAIGIAPNTLIKFLNGNSIRSIPFRLIEEYISKNSCQSSD